MLVKGISEDQKTQKADEVLWVFAYLGQDAYTVCVYNAKRLIYERGNSKVPHQ